jgi:ATP-dependent Clp protease ATP-binding subunit ClpA
LFLGPTGTGETRVVEATAEVLFGDPRAVIKVDRAKSQHSHEIAKPIGSPPGYLGGTARPSEELSRILEKNRFDIDVHCESFSLVEASLPVSQPVSD